MLGDTKRAFREAFDTLNTREQEICILLYVKHLTLREVGEVMGVTESRVSQLHSGIRNKLRQRLHGSRGGAHPDGRLSSASRRSRNARSTGLAASASARS